MAWTDNAIMFWSTDGVTWNKITDHGRAPLDVSVERIEKKSRMVNGTLRRYSVNKKRTLSASWTNIPSKKNSVHNGRTGLTTVDGGWAGEDIEDFHDSVAGDGAFWMKLRKGSDEFKAANDGTLEQFKVMISDFSKSVEKRGVVDLWNLSITLEEV